MSTVSGRSGEFNAHEGRLIISDNPAYETKWLSRADAERLTIVGRVVQVWKEAL
jgi:phage repressor protein C with HTH and peptisase S24 domain